jgi:hypothetical protein
VSFTAKHARIFLLLEIYTTAMHAMNYTILFLISQSHEVAKNLKTFATSRLCEQFASALSIKLCYLIGRLKNTLCTLQLKNKTLWLSAFVAKKTNGIKKIRHSISTIPDLLNYN